MRTDQALLDAIRCPECAGRLDLARSTLAPDGHVIEGTLACAACATAYPITGGVPRLVPRQLERHVEKTIDAFAYQWKHVDAVVRAGRLDSPELFLDFIDPVRPAWFRDKVVLDAGCGLGRFTTAAAGFGAKLVVGLDLSESVDVAFAATRHLPNVAIVQGDILQLPVGACFDYAFSVGVLHHTADPRRAFLQVVSRLVPGGSISAWVYGRENNGWIVHLATPIRRLTSRLPRPVLLAAAHVLAVPITLVVAGVYRPVARSPQLKALRRWLPYFDYLVFLAQFSCREHAVIVFDHAAPAIAEYIRRDDLVEWFQAAGLRDVTISMRGGNSWRGFAKKASAPS